MSCVPEASGCTRGFRKFRRFRQFNGGDRSDDELGDPHPRSDREVIASVIDQQDFHFATIVTIDGAWRIQYGHAMLVRESGSRPDLSFEARRKGHCKSA